MVKPEDFPFLSQKERERVVKLMTAKDKPASHTTSNDGSWKIPSPNKHMIDLISDKFFSKKA